MSLASAKQLWDNTTHAEVSAPHKKCPAFKFGSMRFGKKP